MLKKLLIFASGITTFITIQTSYITIILAGQETFEFFHSSQVITENQEERLFAKSPVKKSRRQQIFHQMTALKKSPKRWIEINLSTQRLIAWQGNKQVYFVTVSTGKASTPTYPGVFKIQRKHSKDRMRGSNYDVPDVPYTMYYYRGYAIHGAYWHNRFGTPVSHGCTNLPVKDAKWLYQWASVGTTVIIHN